MTDTEQTDVDALVADLREKAEAATPTPWEAFRRGEPAGPFGICGEWAGDLDGDIVSDHEAGIAKPDAAFIVALANGWQALTQALDAERAAREAAEAEVERLRDWRRELLDAGFGYDDSDENAAEVLQCQPGWRAEADDAQIRLAAIRERLVSGPWWSIAHGNLVPVNEIMSLLSGETPTLRDPYDFGKTALADPDPAQPTQPAEREDGA